MPARASIGDAPGRSTRAVWFRPPRVPGAAQRERLKAFTLVSAGDGRVVRCRPGIVTHTAFATVPDQRCTASLSLALHRIRDTSHLILAPVGLDPRVLCRKCFLTVL